MSSQGERPGTGAPGVPDVVPTDNELSWMLGDRVTSDDAATLVGECDRAGSRQAVTVYAVTDHTVVVCVQTPVGRRRYFGTTRAAATGVLDGLADREGWRRRP